MRSGTIESRRVLCEYRLTVPYPAAAATLLMVLPILFSCSAAGSAPAAAGRITREARFYVFRDKASPLNHGHWTNFMPAPQDGETTMITHAFVDTPPPFAGDTAVQLDVSFRRPNWCGLAVASKPDYWGKTPSEEVFDLRGAKRLVFSARGERGGEVIQVQVATTGDQPYGDSAKVPASSGWIELKRDWQPYEVSLDGKDLRRVVIIMAIVTDLAHNPRSGKGLRFYLDEIYVDTRGEK